MSKQEVQLSEWEDNPDNDGAFRADENGNIYCSVKEVEGGILVTFRNRIRSTGKLGEMITHPEIVRITPEIKRMDAASIAIKIAEDHLAVNYDFESDVEGYRTRIVEQMKQANEDPNKHLSMAA